MPFIVLGALEDGDYRYYRLATLMMGVIQLLAGIKLHNVTLCLSAEQRLMKTF